MTSILPRTRKGKITLDAIPNEYGNRGFNNESTQVTKTATMGPFSILDANNIEVPNAAAAATAVKIMNDPNFLDIPSENGDVILVATIVRNTMINATYPTYADGSHPTTTTELTTMIANGNQFKFSN